MTLLVLSYLAGILTILSPCILPVLPFVFARADQPFLRTGLPLLAGLALTFTLVAALATIGGAFVVAANVYGRLLALALLALFGLALLWPRFGELIATPFVSLGNRVAGNAKPGEAGGSIISSLLLGVATGLLWAPCAGPILGLVLAGAALHGANVKTVFLLLAYAAGAATSLALALLVGGRVFIALKGGLGASEWIRRALGLAVLAGVAAIALGVDTGFLTRISSANTAGLEQRLIEHLKPQASSGRNQQSADQSAPGAVRSGDLPIQGVMPPLAGASKWLNSPPLTPEALKGKVVLVDFWTYSCINCLRTLPYVRAWWDKYKDHGLVIVGVHTPEFAFEKDPANVERAVRELGLTYPVALDNDYKIWNAFHNEAWPADYLIDAEGRIRESHFGEGAYAETERDIQALLQQAGHEDLPGGIVEPKAEGASARADVNDIDSPETYIGYARALGLDPSQHVLHNTAFAYVAPDHQLAHNVWAFTGDWIVGAEQAVLDKAPGGLIYRFHSRDLHLVLGPGTAGKNVHFRVTIDGKRPGEDHGTDVDADGNGMVTEQRLYQLVRQSGPIADRTFEIEFTDPGVEAYSFTFG